MTTVQSETATEVGELVERLREGPVRTGDTENGEYELFDIEEATATMLVAAWAVTALQSQAAKLKVAEEAFRVFVDKLETVHQHPRYMAMWEVAQLHVGQYDGPNYIDELNAAREALATTGSTDASS